MKNIVFLLIISAIFSISCGSHFNPKYYYNNNSSSDNGPGDSEDIGGGGENLDPNDDPFYDNGDRPWNHPDYGFSMDFDEYVIEASFDKQNRPSYKLVKGTWNQGDVQKNEYLYNGNNTSAAGNNVSSVVYYLYKGKNPTFKPDTSYNQSDRLERFYFYRFTGSALGIVDLDNFLIAIDTYSKLVFAFAVPSLWDDIVGNAVPDQWSAVENGWEADSGNNSKVWFNQTDGIRYFYEYDPVGVVHSDGTIEIYDWCLSSIANNNRYAPRVDGNKIDLTRKIAKENFPGRSPYMPIKVEETIKDTITVTAKSIENISMKSKEKTQGKWHDKAYIMKVLRAAVYNDLSSPEYVKLTDVNGYDSYGTPTTIGSAYAINIGATDTFNVSEEYVLENIKSQNAYIELDTRIWVYDTRNSFIAGHYVETAGGPRNKMTDYENPKIKFRYDSATDSIVFDSISSEEGITIDKSFSVKKGSSKDFTILLDKNGEQCRITYTIGF